MIPEGSSTGMPTPAVAAARNQRYTYLVARLRNRQMTMEEATELFALMDGMLRASEAARLAFVRAAPQAPSAPPPTVPAALAPTIPTAGGDDFLLLGLLAMGAGAGLMAAMGRRMQEAPPAPSPGDRRSSPPASRTG